MARKKGKSNPEQTVIEYRHEEAKRKNIPPAGLAAQGKSPRGFNSFPYQKAGRPLLLIHRYLFMAEPKGFSWLGLFVLLSTF